MLLHSFSTSAASLWLPRGEPVWRTLGRAPCQLLLFSRYQNGIEIHWRAVAQQWLVSSKGPESCFHQWTRTQTPLSHAVPCLPQDERQKDILLFLFSGDLIASRATSVKAIPGASALEDPTWIAHTNWNAVLSQNTRFITASPQKLLSWSSRLFSTLCRWP